MYLSRIELHGFKSFADPTVLRFSDGLTAIVGPNGSGKTNIIDAIRWVLGEQKTSLLRTDAMNQVIFNGTRTRKPLGMAEVSIVIENTQKILPAEFSEVVVTRRLFRDGESQYLLNGSPCRRKDIVDLFTDTGMGADAYSVIELKMVEQILEDHSDERRHLFEEAAGIVKYKQRRKETLAKLDATRTDIERVLDHLTVLRRTVGSLKRQAERAERYAALDTELRSLQAKRLFRTWCAHRNHCQQLEVQRQLLSAELETITTAVATESERISSLASHLSSLENQRNELSVFEQQLSAERSTLASQCAVLEERSRATQSALDSLLEQLRSRSRTHDRIESDLESAQAQLAAAVDEQQVAETQAAELRSTLDAERQRYHELLSAQAQIAEPVRLLERDRERLATMRAHIRHTAEQLGMRSQRLAAELEALRTRSGEVDARIRQTAEDRTHAMQTIAELEQELSAAQARKQELEATIEALRVTKQQLVETASHVRAQRALLESIVEHGELDPKALENAPVQPSVSFGDLLSAPADVAVALESVLGSIAQYPVVETKRELTLLGGWLRKHLRGKAHLICLELVPKFPPPQPLPHTAPARWLAEHISADEPALWLLRALLEGIALVDELDRADELFATFPSIRAVVDRQGQIRTRVGIALLGRAGDTEGLRIGRRKRLKMLTTQLAELDKQQQALEQQIAAAITERDTLDLDARTSALRTAERTLLAIEQSLQEATSQREQLRSTIERLQSELKAIGEEQAALLAEDVALDTQLRESQLQHTQLLARQAEIAERIGQQEQVLSRLDEQLRTTELSAMRIRARIESLRDTIARLEHQRSTIASDQEDTQSEREQLQQLRSQLEAERQLKSQHLAALVSQLEAIASERHALDSELAARRSELTAAHQHLETLRSQREDLTTRLHMLDVELERIRTLQATVAEQLQTQHGIEPASYTATDHRTDEEIDAAINRLTSQVASLGAINFSALEEYTREKQRLDELEAQYRDLQHAEANLRDTIAEINATASEQFLRTFEAIRAHFKELFALLFQGDGDADLVMEGDDPLDARINIIARPKGKRPSSIEMLSGGEKTLTAIALLFAIYLVKPSPFCILDEVDAPLDDANIDRYLALIRRFSASTQFLLITHNKRTMEAADILYGVTMQEPGVSKIVSVRLTEPNQVSHSLA